MGPAACGRGEPFTKSGGIKRLGTIKVAKNGHFLLANAKSMYKNAKVKLTIRTTSQVAGQFVTAKHATGTIRFSQTNHQGSKTLQMRAGQRQLHGQALKLDRLERHRELEQRGKAQSQKRVPGEFEASAGEQLGPVRRA